MAKTKNDKKEVYVNEHKKRKEDGKYKTAIIYRSLFGTAKRYAERLHEEIEADIYKYNQIDELSLLKYDLVILCAGTYAGWISLGGYLKKHWRVLQEGRVILLVIGAAPVDNPWSIRSFEKIPDVIREGIKYFKLPSTIGSREADKIRKENLAPVIEYINSILAIKKWQRVGFEKG